MLTVTFLQLYRVFPAIVELVSTKHAHYYEPPGHGCVNIVHDKFDIFGINCFLPTYCGKSVYKDRLPESTFFTGYYLCQRLSEPVEMRSWNIHFDFELHPFFPGRGTYDVILNDLTIIELQQRYVVMSLASQPYRQQRLAVDDICRYEHADEKVFAYTQMSRSVQTWDTFPEIDLEKMLHLPYAVNFVPSEPYGLYVMPQCPVSLLSVRVEEDVVFSVNRNQFVNCTGTFCQLFAISNEGCAFPFMYNNEIYDDCTKEDWHELWCSIENDGLVVKDWKPCRPLPILSIQLGPKRVLNFNNDVHTSYLSNELGDRMTCDAIWATVATQIPVDFEILNRDKLCGIHELEEPSYGISMQYNSTHFVKNNGLYRSQHSYQCDAVIPVITDVMDIGGIVSMALNFIFSLLVYFVQEIFIIFRGISVNLDALFAKLLQELVYAINAFLEAVVYLLIKLELLRPLCYGGVVFIVIDLKYRNRIFSTICALFAVYLYLNVEN